MSVTVDWKPAGAAPKRMPVAVQSRRDQPGLAIYSQSPCAYDSTHAIMAYACHRSVTLYLCLPTLPLALTFPLHSKLNTPDLVLPWWGLPCSQARL